MGSTPGRTSAPFVEGVTEGRPGTYVYFDAQPGPAGQRTLDRCAQTVLTRVVACSGPGADHRRRRQGDELGRDPAAGAVGSSATDGRPLEASRSSDGQRGARLPAATDGAGCGVGDLLRVVPNHACGTTNMWSHLYAVRGDAAVERWEISARH